jgi:N-acyl-D-aspartate/D-glutamate deacylase
MWFDVLLRNGRVLDGAGNPWFKADIAIKDGRISKIERIGSDRASRTIDVGGLIICPGFIDMHNHSDFSLLVDPKMESKVRQGVTTDVNGNCGNSPAPVNENVLKFRELKDISEEEVDWTTMDGYFKRLEKQGISQNAVTLVGHGTVRYHVMGDVRRTSTPSELEGMKELVREAMEDGALGLSTGLTYAPGYYADTAEVIELAKVVAEYDGLYASHIREWGSKVLGWPGAYGSTLEGVAEAIEIGRKSGVRAVEISHLSAHRRVADDPEQYNKVRRLIDSAREGRINVTVDVLPSQGWDTVHPLHHAIPPVYLAEGVEKMLERLRDPSTRAKIKNEMKTKTPADLGFVYHAMGLLLIRAGKGDYLMIYPPFNGHLKNREYDWKTLGEIAEIKGKDLYDTLFDLLVEEEDNIYANTGAMDRDLKNSEFIWPTTMVSTDGGSVDKTGSLATARVRPSAFGGFPDALAWVRDKKLISLEDMVRRMTSMPARTIGLKDRGLIKEGFWADITVFDPETVINRCTFQNDARPEYPAGIQYVLVNGQIVVDDNEHTGLLPGKVLKHPF